MRALVLYAGVVGFDWMCGSIAGVRRAMSDGRLKAGGN